MPPLYSFDLFMFIGLPGHMELLIIVFILIFFVITPIIVVRLVVKHLLGSGKTCDIGTPPHSETGNIPPIINEAVKRE